MNGAYHHYSFKHIICYNDEITLDKHACLVDVSLVLTRLLYMNDEVIKSTETSVDKSDWLSEKPYISYVFCISV